MCKITKINSQLNIFAKCALGCIGLILHILHFSLKIRVCLHHSYWATSGLFFIMSETFFFMFHKIVSYYKEAKWTSLHSIHYILYN